MTQEAEVDFFHELYVYRANANQRGGVIAYVPMSTEKVGITLGNPAHQSKGLFNGYSQKIEAQAGNGDSGRRHFRRFLRGLEASSRSRAGRHRSGRLVGDTKTSAIIRFGPWDCVDWPAVRLIDSTKTDRR